MEHWKELVAAVIAAGASAAATGWATTQVHEAKIANMRDEVRYIRERVDAIYDRLPGRAS
jgi:copper oxidase (laccase) domain-containing protein